MSTRNVLDSRAWPVVLCFEAYGASVLLRASDASLRAQLEELAPPGARVIEAARPDVTCSIVVGNGSHEVYDEHECIVRGSAPEELFVALESRLHLRVAAVARTRLFVHAGVVGWRGGAIVIPGRSRTGKSSLVAALLAHGASYYSDEYAVLDDGGHVHPFARALHIRESSGRTRRVSANALGAAVGEEPLPVRMVIAARHVFGACWQPTPMSAGETVLALLDNTVAARHRPADALRILGTVVEGSVGLRGDRGDAVDSAERILSSIHAH